MFIPLLKPGTVFHRLLQGYSLLGSRRFKGAVCNFVQNRAKFNYGFEDMAKMERQRASRQRISYPDLSIISKIIQ